jgi:tetratricopeptide (TPR) repeat protein
MAMTKFDAQFRKALNAGANRDYKTAIAILEDLAAQGLADPNARDPGHPEIYLYLARAWHSEKIFSRAVFCARTYIGYRTDDGSGWFFLGRSLMADGQYARAAHALKKAVALNGASIDARALLGLALLRGRRPVAARVAFEEALSLAPDDPRLNQGYLNALFVEAVRSYRAGDAESARQMLTFLINNDIDGVVPRLYLGHALRDLGYLPEALGQYEAAIQFAPDDPSLKWYPVSILVASGEAEKAAALMAELGEAPPEGALSARMVTMRIVRRHLDAGDWSAAAQAARTALREDDGDAQMHALMGEAMRNMGNRDASINHFIRALELDRENPAPWYGVFLNLAAARDWESLLASLPKAERELGDADTVEYYRVVAEANLDRDPQELLPRIQEQVRRRGAEGELAGALARTYFRLGLAELAVGWYEKALSTDADNEVAWLGKIACLEALDSSDALAKAYADYLAKWEDNAAIRRDYYAFLNAREDWALAADQLEEIARFEGSPVSGRQLALLRRKAGQFRSAAVLYRNMLRKKPDDRAMLANLVYCLDRMGESPSALALIQRANKALKPDAEGLLIEGRLLERAGKRSAALEPYRACVERFPKDVRGWEAVAQIYAKQGVTGMAAMYAEKARDLRAPQGKRARSAARASPDARGRKK